jgi:hypothetical protein
MNAALTGEVQEYAGGRWRTVHLGDQVTVRDRRRIHIDRPATFATTHPGGEGGSAPRRPDPDVPGLPPPGAD